MKQDYEDKPDSKDDQELIEEALDRFKLCEENENINRERALEAIKFRDLEQWPFEIQKARETDPDGARPCLVMDKTNQHIHQITNDQRQARPGIKVRPVDDNADPDTAEALQGLIRNIEDQSNADQAYDTAFEQAVDGGFGYFRILADYPDDDVFYQDLFIRRIRNRFCVYLDPSRQEPDGSDSEYGFVVEDVKAKDFKKKYPNAKGDWEAVTKTHPAWMSEEYVRVAEYYKFKKTEERIYLINNQVMTQKEFDDANPETHPHLFHAVGFNQNDVLYEKMSLEGVPSRKRTKRQLCWYKLTALEVLESRELPGKWIPIVEVIGNEIDIEGESRKSGLVRSAMDGQRMYNYASSAFVEMVALAPKAPFIAAEGQVEGHEDEWQAANRRNIAVLTYNPVESNGHMLPAPQRQPMPGIPTGWDRSLAHFEHDIQGSMGRYNASLGAETNEKSGIALQRKQVEADTGSFHFQDNLARSIRHAGRILINLIPHYYDTPRIARILGEDGTESMARFDPTINAAHHQYRDNQGKLQSIFNPTIGKYDVSVTTGPSYTTKRQEAADAMIQVVQAAPNLMQFIGDLLFKNQDWPGADEIADRLKKLLPPELQSEEDDPRVQQMAAMIQKLQQELMTSEQGKEAKELEIKAKDSDTKAYEAETHRMAVGSDKAIEALAEKLAQMDTTLQQILNVRLQ